MQTCPITSSSLGRSERIAVPSAKRENKLLFKYAISDKGRFSRDDRGDAPAHVYAVDVTQNKQIKQLRVYDCGLQL